MGAGRVKVASRFPAGTARNADFVTRRAKLKAGERVVNLQVDLDTLPAFGLLCVTETTVKMMVDKLGLELAADADAEAKATIDKLKAENAELTRKLTEIQKAAA